MSTARKWLCITVIGSSSLCVTCASSIVCTTLLSGAQWLAERMFSTPLRRWELRSLCTSRTRSPFSGSPSSCLAWASRESGRSCSRPPQLIVTYTGHCSSVPCLKYMDAVRYTARASFSSSSSAGPLLSHPILVRIAGLGFVEAADSPVSCLSCLPVHHRHVRLRFPECGRRERIRPLRERPGRNVSTCSNLNRAASSQSSLADRWPFIL
jgi:hypothetical protein